MIKGVFLPGLDGSGFLFEPLARLWPADGPAPLALTYPPDRFLNYAELEAFILPKLPTTESYLLIAESFGGPLAVRLAARRPPMLRGLVLSATFVRQPRGWVGSLGEILVGPYLFRRPLFRVLGTLAMKAQGMPEWEMDLVSKALHSTRPVVLAARLKAAVDVDALPDLKECPVPVLCLYAKRDLLLAKRCAELIGENAPHVRLIGLDTPHYLLQDKPDEAFREIQRFAEPLQIPA